MQVVINDTVKEVPFDISAITLGKFVEYYERYGRDFDKKLEAILTNDYDKQLKDAGYSIVTPEDLLLHRNIDLDAHVDNEALAWLSFWTGFDLFEVRTQPYITPLLSQYRVFRFQLDESMKAAVDLPTVILWNNEEWQIKDFAVNAASEMTFNEIITSKEVMRQVYSIGKGKWDALPYLCAVFFRKKGEAFDDALIAPDGERLKELQQLPLVHALQVAFFLSICVSTWKNTFQSSEPAREAIANLN